MNKKLDIIWSSGNLQIGKIDFQNIEQGNGDCLLLFDGEGLNANIDSISLKAINSMPNLIQFNKVNEINLLKSFSVIHCPAISIEGINYFSSELIEIDGF